MSILIKGMEMPKKCGDCVCELYLWCGAKQKPIDDLESKPSWCPITEVPPHGRLIDADDIENITVIMNENGTGFNRIVAPTIIEADTVMT